MCRTSQLDASDFILNSFLFLLFLGVPSLPHLSFTVFFELLQPLFFHFYSKRLGLFGFEFCFLFLAQFFLSLKIVVKFLLVPVVNMQLKSSTNHFESVNKDVETRSLQRRFWMFVRSKQHAISCFLGDSSEAKENVLKSATTLLFTHVSKFHN